MLHRPLVQEKKRRHHSGKKDNDEKKRTENNKERMIAFSDYKKIRSTVRSVAREGGGGVGKPPAKNERHLPVSALLRKKGGKGPQPARRS